MRFVIPVPAFQPAFSAACLGASKNSPKPIMQQVLCRATADGVLRLEGTDGGRAVIATVEGVQVDQPGDAVLHAAKLTEILRESRGKVLTVDAREDAVRVLAKGEQQTRGSEFRLPAFAAAEFPAIGERMAGAQAVGRLTGEQLLGAVSRAGFAASDEVLSEQLQARGVLIQVSQSGGVGKLAVFGHHPTFAALGTVAAEHLADGGVMVPSAGLSLIRAVIEDDSQSVEVRVSPAFLVLVSATRTLLITALESPMPPISRIIPPRTATPLAKWEDARPLLQAAREAAVTTDRENVRGDCSLSADGGVIRTQTAESGASEIPFDLQGYEGPPVAVGFNSHHLRAMAAGLKGEQSVQGEIHEINDFHRLVLRYGTPEAGGAAVIQQMHAR